MLNQPLSITECSEMIYLKVWEIIKTNFMKNKDFLFKDLKY